MLKKLNMSPAVKRVLVVSACLCVCMCMMLCFASAVDTTEVSEPTYASAAETVFDSVHAVINFNNILAIIGVALGAEATLFMLWWGIRKVIRLVNNGLHGKLKA